MEEISNNAVRKFINKFENKFCQFLAYPDSKKISQDRKVVTGNHSVILPGTTKFSDWDIYFFIDEKKINLSILKEINLFIKTFSGFDLVRDFTTNEKYHSESYQRFSNLHFIQYMAFIPRESFAPFVDIHLVGINKKMMKDFYKPNLEKLGKGYLSWAILSHWRKLIKGDNNGSPSFLRYSILPAFSIEEQEKIKNKPKKFFEKYFDAQPEFKEVISFLTKV